MSAIDPKVLVKFEVKEREEETFILRAVFNDLKFNSFAGDLLSFNNKYKEPIFEQYVEKIMDVEEVMDSDSLLEAIKGLDKMIYEDTRLADYLRVDVVESLVMILKESDNVFIQMSAAYILSWAKIDTCDTIIREKAIPVLVDLLSNESFIIVTSVFITLTRFACRFTDYVRVIIEKGALEAVHEVVSQMVRDTILMDSLAKFMAVVCRAKVFPEKDYLCLHIIERVIYMGTLHIERACYALQYLSYKRYIGIQERTINKLTQFYCEKNNAVAASALGVLGNIARWGNSHQIQILAKNPDILLCLWMSLSGKPMKLRWEVCLIVSKIADQSHTFTQLAKEVFESYRQKLVEENLSPILLRLESKKRLMYMGRTKVFEELNKILEFNALLIALKEHRDTRSFAGDLQTVSSLGNIKKDDLKLLYTRYVTDSLSLGRMEEDKLAALEQLKIIFCLSEEEVDSIRPTITSYVYHELFARHISADRLNAAQSEKVFLENLSQGLYFDAQKDVKNP
ncbi:uncharacterized protein LOC141678586 [Apium graveolens]|uniref:uncharacterized protein LOC141678586 n=1 Tax=Apium graveolens TaxID=4045 RepID=UPI003D7940E3